MDENAKTLWTKHLNLPAALHMQQKGLEKKNQPKFYLLESLRNKHKQPLTKQTSHSRISLGPVRSMAEPCQATQTNDYYFVLLDYFPLFLNFLTSLIKFAL